MILYLNGHFIEQDNAHIPITDRGFLLGDGVFDTMAVKDGIPLYAEAHAARLSDHAESLGIPLSAATANILRPAALDAPPPSPSSASKTTNLELCKIIEGLIERNNLKTGYAAIRTTLTRGPGQRGLATPTPEDTRPTLLITIAPFDPAPFAKPATAIIAQSVRRNEGSPLSRIKSLNYGDNILAQNEAAAAGVDTALMLNNAGHVACATNGNIFIEEKGRLYTPPLSDGVLNGIMRQTILDQHDVTEQSLTPERLSAADALWVTNSLIKIRPVQSLNGHAYPPKRLEIKE